MDYYLQEGPTLKFRYIYLWCNQRKFKFVVLILHSLELIFILWAGISIFKLGLGWIAVAIGLSQHMVLDIIFNRKMLYSYSYFLSYRLAKGFRREHLLK